MSKKQPDLIAYHVTEAREEGGKGFWTKIGAAWAQRDGEGYSLDLQLFPANGGKIVLRVPKERDDSKTGGTVEDDEIPY
jgi:hypothetical protein